MDLYEQAVKDACYYLVNAGKLKRLHAEILLHSHGIDEFFPKKTAKEIASLYNIKNNEVKVIRYNTSKKIIKHIHSKSDRYIVKEHKKVIRYSKDITIRLLPEQLDILERFCKTKNKSSADIIRGLIDRMKYRI